MATQALFDIGNVILEPSPTFARLKDKPRAWVPLAILILLTVAITYWYVATLDFAWFREHMLAAQGAVKPEQRAAMEHFLTPTRMLWSTVIGILLGTPVMFALTAVYYLLAGKVMGTGIGYGKWFAFAAWTSIPRLLALPQCVRRERTDACHPLSCDNCATFCCHGKRQQCISLNRAHFPLYAEHTNSTKTGLEKNCVRQARARR